MKELANQILDELRKMLTSIDAAETNTLVEAILESQRVFVVGRGRTGMIAGTFAMRLMHLGFQTYVVGELTTPRIASHDLLIACSGSGEVRMVQQMVRIAKEAKAGAVLITYNPQSTIARCVDNTITIPVSFPDMDEQHRNRKSTDILFPLGSRFEESLMLFLDLVILLLMRRVNITERDMAVRHTNLE